MSTSGGRFDFDDGGTYAGGWEDGKANGYGVCTGPKGQGEFAGAWHLGFETSGVYTWSSGNNYKGQWTQGKRHGVGVEVKGRWTYQGEWSQGFKGRYGIRQSTSTGAKYEGTWTTGLQDGYGVETYADGGIYQGQWLRGIRHGYGLRQSVPYGLAARHQQKLGRESLTSLRSEHEEDSVVKDRNRKLDEKRGGFILTPIRAQDVVLSPVKKRSTSAEGKSRSIRKTLMQGLNLRKLRSTGDIQDPSGTTGRLGGPGGAAGGSVRSTVSNLSFGSLRSSVTAASTHTDSSIASFVSQDDITDVNMVETYTGEWKGDKRSGFGVSERSDGLKYEGEWDANKRHGYGSTTFRDGSKEEGKYKNNVLITSGKKSTIFMLRANKLRDRVQNAVTTARSAAQIALQKSDIAVNRMATARSKAELAVAAANKAQSDAEKSRVKAAEYAPDFMHAHGDKTTEQVPIRSPLLSFVEHYDISSAPGPRPADLSRSPLPTIAAKSILQRVANITGTERSHQEARRPPPSIASALMSVAVESSAPLMKNMNKGVPSGGSGLAGLGGALAIGLGGMVPTGATGPPGQQTTMMAERSNHLSDFRAAETSDVIAADVSASILPTSSDRLSDALDATRIDDHFDQYQTWSRPPPASSSVSSRSARHVVRPRNPFGPHSQEEGPEPSDAGPSRRLTLTGGGGGQGIGAVPPLPQPSAFVRSSQGPSRGGVQQRISENGDLLRGPRDSTEGPGFLRAPPPPLRPVSTGMRRATGKRGSLPDVPDGSSFFGGGGGGGGGAQSQMPREEVHLMSLRRREEIRREREAEARRRQEQVVLSFSEFKEWCRERQLVVLVLAVNLSLATMFFNLLST